MASSSKRTRRGLGGTFSGEGGPSVARGAAARVSKDSSDSSGSGSRSSEPFGDVLGQPLLTHVIREDSAADVTWTSNFREIRDLQIQRNEMLAVPLIFYFQCSRAIEWADWIDLELADKEFCDRLEWAGVLPSILISRCSNMYRDTKALRQLIQKWYPSTHTFFFAHGELTVTLEDVENHWLLPILGDQGPADLVLSPEELEIEAALADYIGRKNIALGTQAARFKPWMEHFNRETDPLIRRAAFVAYWLSKCVFGEHPAYSIKPLYFPLAVKIAAGVCFPLAPLLLGQLYTQLDLLHAEELVGASCHIITTKPYEARNKFASMPEGVVANVGDFQGDVPAVYRWVGSKFYDHGLVPSLDSESKICWRPYGVSHRGFVYESVMSGFSNVKAQDYTLIAGDMVSLTYLSATNAGWLPILSSGGLQFTVYSAHRVRKQFGFDQEIPAVMGIAADEIPTINPFLRSSAFTYWSGIAPRVIVPSGDRIGVYTTGMSNYWRGLMAAMVEFRNSGRGDISHLLESYTSPLPHPRLFMATNTMTTYANRQSLGYACHPAEEEGMLLLEPSPAGESAAQGVSAPASKKTVRKTRAGKRTFVPPAFPSAPSSIAARVAARKSSRGVVYSEKRSKQRADTVARDDLSNSSSSSDKDDPSRAATEEVESEDTETAAAETVSGADDFAVEASFANEGTVPSTFFGEEEDEVSMDELKAAEAAFDSDSTASASKLKSAEGAVEEHATVRVATNAERVVETTPITITNSGGTAQGGLSGSGSHVEPSLLDSSASTRQCVRRARRESLMSTDFERTASVTVRVPTPSSSLHESGGTAPTPIIIATAVSAAATVQESETAPAVAEEVPGNEEVLAHIPEVPEGNIFVESISIDENLVIDVDFDAGMTHVEHAEVAASEEPVQADVIPGSDVPVIEKELAQGHVNDIDMGDAHDSYDEVLAKTEDHMAGAQAVDIEVTAPMTAHASPTKTGELNGHGLILICRPPSDKPGLMPSCCSPSRPNWLSSVDMAGSGNETVAEEERRLQTAAVESAVRGQPGLLSAARSATLGSSVLADLDAFFREFDHTSFSSRHAEHFWTFDDVKANFEIFRVQRGGIRLEDITEVHILEWKAVVQEAIEGGFKFGFILDYLRRLARDIFSRRVLAELRVAEARVAALRDALNTVAPDPWDLASARRVSAANSC
uniref:Aminotransferase-like plant mobile domain-containing protein n=1 Tax=Fagus sylvatica TaxID=28930 RepID=A0A2N9FDZ1_FAGSY